MPHWPQPERGPCSKEDPTYPPQNLISEIIFKKWIGILLGEKQRESPKKILIHIEANC